MTADIASIRARIAAATPGPWAAEWSDDDQWWQITGQPHDDGGHWLVCPEVATSDEPDGTEADLIAHAPADLAALCDEVEALRAKLEDFTEAASGARSEMDAYGRSLGHALAQEIQRRELAEAELELLRDELARTRAVASDE